MGFFKCMCTRSGLKVRVWGSLQWESSVFDHDVYVSRLGSREIPLEESTVNYSVLAGFIDYEQWRTRLYATFHFFRAKVRSLEGPSRSVSIYFYQKYQIYNGGDILQDQIACSPCPAHEIAP